MGWAAENKLCYNHACLHDDENNEWYHLISHKLIDHDNIYIHKLTHSWKIWILFALLRKKIKRVFKIRILRKCGPHYIFILLLGRWYHLQLYTPLSTSTFCKAIFFSIFLVKLCMAPSCFLGFYDYYYYYFFKSPYQKDALQVDVDCNYPQRASAL